MLFYIVETKEQLDILLNKKYKEVFIEPIYFNDNIHPALNDLSLLYLKPLNNDKGYILCINHTESLSLSKIDINELLLSYGKIYVRDRKSFIYDFPIRNIIDISFTIPEYSEPTTKSHDFFYQKHSNLFNINQLIPLVKHYEKCELIFSLIKDYYTKLDNSEFYNKLTSVFFAIEKNGIKINQNIFSNYFNLQHEANSLFNNKIYTQYNLHTTTGRPSNSFNGINFAALKKDDGCRESFIPENNSFIEIDINSYHPTLAAQLVGYNFGEETPYQYFAKQANIEISEAKILMFKQLYGGIYKEYKHINYFQLIQKYVDEMWEKFKNDGFIKCNLSGHKFIYNPSIFTPQKLFNYVLQNLETSTNVFILWDIIKILSNKKSKIVLYTYDSILIDHNESDNILPLIKQVFDKYGLKIKLTKGTTYQNMINIC